MAEDSKPQLTQEESDLARALGGRNGAAFASGSTIAPVPGQPSAPAAPGYNGDPVKSNKDFVDRNGKVNITDGAPHNPAIDGMAMRIMGDGHINGTLTVLPGYDAAPALRIAPGTSKADMTQIVTAYLDQTGAFPKNYAGKFLNDKDGSFLKSVQDFINKQSDSSDSAYVKPILDSMKIAAAQYNGVSAAPSAAPVIAPVTPKR